VQNRFGRFAAIAAVALLNVPAAAQSHGVDVVVEVTNLRNTRGTILACLTNEEARFPRCRDDAHSHRLSVPANGSLVLRFHDVTPGDYAIALLHDENNNGRADRALSMIPREGFGFSRDAPVRMGPPSFEDAAITVGTAALRQTIRMRYML
jgi:uncharacterized protein (DUF2141 family)